MATREITRPVIAAFENDSAQIGGAQAIVELLREVGIILDAMRNTEGIEFIATRHRRHRSQDNQSRKSRDRYFRRWLPRNEHVGN